MPTVKRSPFAVLVALVALSGGTEAWPGTVDLAYSTLDPCRLIDTRLAGGPIPAGTTRNFKVKGSGSLAGQGGSASGCGVPSDATGAMINLVAVNSAGPGHLTAWAYPVSTLPTASTLNYGVIPGLVAIANGLAVPICDPDASTCSSDLRINAAVSATDVVADVVGYFRQPFPAPATCSSPPCSVALCSDGPSISCTPISSTSGACTAVSQTGTCKGTAQCKVCQGPAGPASSSAVCSDGSSVNCSIATVGSVVGGACSATAVGGVCHGTFQCKVCQTP